MYSMRTHHTMLVTGVLRPTHIALLTGHTIDEAQKPLSVIKSQEKICWKLFDAFDDDYGDAVVFPIAADKV